MNKEFYGCLWCPECHGDLDVSVTKVEKDEVLEGVITCVKCKRTYDIREGIPRMLPDFFRAVDKMKITVGQIEYNRSKDVGEIKHE